MKHEAFVYRYSFLFRIFSSSISSVTSSEKGKRKINARPPTQESRDASFGLPPWTPRAQKAVQDGVSPEEPVTAQLTPLYLIT